MSLFSRRTLIRGFGVSVITAPAVVPYANLMPVRKIILPAEVEPLLSIPRLSSALFPFGKYKLVGQKPVPVENLMEWAAGFGQDNNRIANDDVGSVHVSTVFLGLDHNYLREGPPVLFETMVFGGKHDGDMRRYATYEDAERGHKETLTEVKRSQIGIVRHDDS